MSARAGAVWVAAGVLLAGIVSTVQPAAQNGAPHFTISGTSTVRAWSCPADGTVKVKPGSAQPAPGFPSGVSSVTVTVPVKAIACETDLMNEHLRETLKASTYPDIVYQLDSYAPTDSATVKAVGKLTITGVTQPISFDVKLTPAAEGVHAVGETTIDLTQWSVPPPVIFDGLLKVGKSVRVKFDAVLPTK